MNKLVTASIIITFLVAGCTVTRAKYAFTPIPHGLVATTGATISAEDGSFQLVAGQRFQSPFQQGDRCLLAPTSDNYAEGLASGARPVVIELADGRRLFGLLSLCSAPPSAAGTAASREYQIQIPESYVAEIAGGRVSVVFELFPKGKLQAKSWILWLSETSFTGHPPAPVGRTANTEIEKQLDQARISMKISRYSGIGGGILGLIALKVLTSDPAGGEIAVGAVAGLLGLTGLIMWPVFFGVAKGQESQLQTKLGALEDHRRDTQIARPEARATTLGWSWSF